MNAQDLRGLLEKARDKFNIFANKNVLFQYDMNFSELLELIKDFLNDEEKSKILEIEHFKGFSSGIKTNIILLIQERSIRFKILDNDELIKSLDSDGIIKIITTLEDNSIIQILKRKKFLEQNNIDSYQIEKIIVSMSDEGKNEFLSNKEIIEDLEIEQYVIANMTSTINSENYKKNIIDMYDFEEYQITNIVKTFSSEEKLSIILANRYDFRKNNLVELISTLDIDSLVRFIKNNKEFLKDNKIKPYNITTILKSEKQLEFLSKFEEAELTIAEKRQILVRLSGKAKSTIDTSNIPQEYIKAIEMEINNDLSKGIMAYGKIIPDFNQNLEEYKDLDELIYI